MADLVIVVPSRGRPERATEMLAACRATSTAHTAYLVTVDVDDPTLPAYRKAITDRFVLVYAVKPAGHVGAINAGAERALRWQRPYAIGKLDDDHRPRTRGWDSALLDALRAAGSGIAYGNDLLQGQNLPTAPVITADIIKTLGWMAPPTLRHLYCDNFWRDLGEQAGCLHYLPSVVVEHMHPLAGKAPMDDGYRRVNAPERFSEDGAAYEAYKRDDLAADAAKVRALRVTV